MSKFQQLHYNPPKIMVDKENPREVHFTTVSAMCDNEHKISFRRQDSGEYRVSAGIHALSNFQMKGDYLIDLQWYAEDGEWDKVVNVINTGTSRVESVRYR